MARLIARCLDEEGWDSKKVEAKERRSQKWVWNMADFGRFLSVSTKCTNSDSHKLATLNEGTYRKHKSTCGSFDQSAARLLRDSGWTQEEIAEVVKISRPYISQLMTFGEFLRIVATGNNFVLLPKNLTERRFRQYWAKADNDAAPVYAGAAG
jgi:hypothetical protein